MNYVNDKFQRSFEIVAERFLSKIGFGELIVTFPSGSTKSFKGTDGDEIADLKLHNYKFISKLNREKNPRVTITSWNKAKIAPRLNCHSNLIQI